MRFRISIYADINIDDKNLEWETIEDVREVVTLLAEETVKFISEECETGVYNPYLGGVAYFPIGKLPEKEEIDRL